MSAAQRRGMLIVMWIWWSLALIGIQDIWFCVALKIRHRDPGYENLNANAMPTAEEQAAISRLSPNHKLPPLPIIEQPGGKVTGIRAQLPPRETDLPNIDNMLLPNTITQPGYVPNLPLATTQSSIDQRPSSLSAGGHPTAKMVQQQTTNNSPGVPILDTPAADLALMVPETQYHPTALSALGAKGGSSGKDLLALQMASQTQGVALPGVPKLDVPGLPQNFVSNLPPLGSSVPDLQVPQVPDINTNMPYMKTQQPSLQHSGAEHSDSKLNVPNLQDPRVHIPQASPVNVPPPNLPLTPVTNGQSSNMALPNIEMPNITMPDATVPNLDLSPPPILSAVIGLAGSLVGALGVIGFEMKTDCTKMSGDVTLVRLKGCALDTMTETSSAFDDLYQSAMMNSRIMAGGKVAEVGLTRERNIWSDPYGPQSLKGTELAALMTAAKESTPDRLRWQLLSMMTLLSGVPTAVNIDDVRTGGYGHVNLVIPSPSRVYEADHVIPLLKSGVNPDDIVEGSTFDAEGVAEIDPETLLKQ